MPPYPREFPTCGIIRPAEGFPVAFHIEGGPLELFVTDKTRSALERARIRVGFSTVRVRVHDDADAARAFLDTLPAPPAPPPPPAPVDPLLFLEVWRHERRLLLVGLVGSFKSPKRRGLARVSGGFPGLASALRDWSRRQPPDREVHEEEIARAFGLSGTDELATETQRCTVWRGRPDARTAGVTQLIGAPWSAWLPSEHLRVTSSTQLRLAFRAPFARVVKGIREVLQATLEGRPARSGEDERATLLSVFKWRDELVVRPKWGSRLESVALGRCVRVPEGYAGLPRALREAARIARSIKRRR